MKRNHISLKREIARPPGSASLFSHPRGWQKVYIQVLSFIGLTSGNCGGHWSTANSLSCSWNQFVMIWAFECIMLLEVAAGSWKCTGQGQQQNSHKHSLLCHINHAQLVLRGPKYATVTFPAPLHPHSNPKPDGCFHIVYAKLWAWMNCSLTFLFLTDRSGTQCGLLLL